MGDEYINMVRKTNKQSGKIIIKSLFWKFAERCGAQLSSFIVSMVLARILAPEEYGLLSILLIFISISQVIVQSGLGMALIQKKEVDNNDYSSVLYISIILSVILYLIMYMSAPSISIYFNMNLLGPTLRVMSVTLFFGAGTSVLNSMLVRQMNFSKLFICNISASIVSGIVGILMAHFGCGAWALVFQYIINQLMALVTMEMVTKWKPNGIKSIKNVRPLFNYGYKLLITNLISTGYNELRSLAIGKKYSSAVLAYYDKGKQIPQFVLNNINATIENVMLPVYSSQQENINRLKVMLSYSMRVSSFILFPVIIGLCIIAKPLVILILTEKWISCIPFLVISALTFLLSPLQTSNAQVINAMGRSDTFLRLEIIKKIVGIIILLLSVFLFDDVIYVAYGGLALAIISSIINMMPNRYYLNYSIRSQVLDLLPNIMISAVMAICIYPLSFVFDNDLLLITSQVILGVVIYILLALVTKNKAFKLLLDVLKGRRDILI